MFAELNAVSTRLMGGVRPARAVVAVSCLPCEALVEVERVATVPGATGASS